MVYRSSKGDNEWNWDDTEPRDVELLALAHETRLSDRPRKLLPHSDLIGVYQHFYRSPVFCSFAFLPRSLLNITSMIRTRVPSTLASAVRAVERGEVSESFSRSTA